MMMTYVAGGRAIKTGVGFSVSSRTAPRGCTYALVHAVSVEGDMNGGQIETEDEERF
jgi:hypothetical protein